MLSTQQNAAVLLGDSLADLPPPNGVPDVGTIFRSQSTGDCLMLVSLGPGVKAWVPIAGAAALGWPKYVVSPAGDIPVAAFTSIQAAINQAVADGHNAGNPTKVVLYAGIYNESITLVPGISVVSFANDGFFAGSSIIRGTVTIGPTSGSYALVNVVVEGPIVVSAANSNVLLQDVNGSPLVTGILPLVFSGAGTSLDIEGGAYVGQQNSDIPFSAFGANSQVFARDVTFTNQPSQSGAALSLTGGAGAQNVFVDCRINGQIATGAATVATIRDSLVTANVAPFSVGSGTSILMFGGAIGGSFTVLTTGGGLVTIENVQSLNGIAEVGTASATIGVLMLRSYTKLLVAPAAGPFTIDSNEDEVFLQPTGGAVANLPATNTMIDGRRITIKTNGAFNVTVTPAGADTIDGFASFLLAANVSAPQPAVTLQVDRIHARWDIISRAV